VKTMPCRVEKLEKRADDVMVMKIKLPANERLQFLAGQYIDFQLKTANRAAIRSPIRRTTTRCWNCISATSPRVFSDQVFSTLKERDILRLKGRWQLFHPRGFRQAMLFIAGEPVLRRSRPCWSTRLPRTWIAKCAVLGSAFIEGSVHGRTTAAVDGRASNFSFIPVLSNPQRTTSGRAAPASCTKRCWPILPTCQATRCMPAARPVMSTARATAL